jgi:hypothetical protein
MKKTTPQGYRPHSTIREEKGILEEQWNNHLKHRKPHCKREPEALIIESTQIGY